MTVEMDLLDRRILFELDCNSRRPLSEISRKVRLGRDLVTYRIERLQAEGVLKRCSATVNPYKLGLTVYKTYLKLEAQRDRWAQFIQHLDAHPSTSWLAECYGKWDVIWCTFARSPKEVYDLQDRLFSDYRDIIPAYNVSTLVNYWWFPKKYLIGSSSSEVQSWAFEPPEFTFGTTPAEMQLDEIESGIVQLLSENCRLSVTEIANRLDTTPAIVKYRLEKLEQGGVIGGYRVDIDRSLLGMTLYKVQVHLREYNAERELEFHAYCRHHPHIGEYVNQLGDSKLEFVVEARHYEEFTAVIDQIREQFSDYIRSMDYMMVKNDYFHRTPCSVFAPLQPPCQLESESIVLKPAA